MLDETPTRHPRCCASLSVPLLALLDEVLPAGPQLTLSVGSGSGLLEACLLAWMPQRSALKGVEVFSVPEVNVYLPPEHMVVCQGTWHVPEVTEEASGLLFVYPRQASTVNAYLRKATRASTAVWIGPRCDADEFRPVFDAWGSPVHVDKADEAVDPGEIVFVVRRRRNGFMSSSTEK